MLYFASIQLCYNQLVFHCSLLTLAASYADLVERTDAKRFVDPIDTCATAATTNRCTLVVVGLTGLAAVS